MGLRRTSLLRDATNAGLEVGNCTLETSRIPPYTIKGNREMEI
jgi:hypothetical protein